MLCNNLKTIRKNKGYSQEELAGRIHVTRQTVSKWENGQSVPDAEMLRSIADVFGVSVSELMDGDAEKILENEVIIDQLARINEQLIISNHKIKDRNRNLTMIFIGIAAIVVLIFGSYAIKQRNIRGYKINAPEHLGVLTYSIPYKTFYHAKNDVGVRVENNGKYRISCKLYKNYNDMTEISIWDEGLYSRECIDEFKEKYPAAREVQMLEHYTLPDETEYFICATDSGLGQDGYYHIGSYYKAYIVLDEMMYFIDVTNGDMPLENAEFVISTMVIDYTKQDEYLNNTDR